MKAVPAAFARDSGHVVAFAIENVYISLTTVARLLKNTDGVTDVVPRKIFSRSRSDIHIRFKYHGEPCIVLEPWGDNSDYWICPDVENSSNVSNITPLETVFKRYRPPFYRLFIGHVVTFLNDTLVRFIAWPFRPLIHRYWTRFLSRHKPK